MFILNLTYRKPLAEVEQFLSDHIRFLDQYYQRNVFICSGRKVPRTGGIILCNCKDKDEAETIIQNDPFYREKIAKYEIVEFVPSKASDLFNCALL
ncbi:YciI family protein [Anaerosinus massiliensis]|uniref:YciI family protein n=1 Tax=Massilibacillus massiliensis TaxID=1806837 RepID=UPI000AA1DA9A|nr:YciI family protein [Massilibacillus massiliensis]